MNSKLLLTKCITLLYRESKLKDKTENSADLVRTVLEKISIPESAIGFNTDRDVIKSLKETILEMCLQPVDHEYDSYSLLETLKINCGYDDRLYDALESAIKQDVPENQLKRSIVNIRKSIANHFKTEEIENLLTKASHDFRFRRETIGDINTFISHLISQLEPLQISSSIKDPAVVSDIDISDYESTAVIFKEIKENNTKDGLMVTGWQCVNKMLQGGFRRGEFAVISALQHKYKTGFTLSLFQQIPIYNVPKLLNPNRRPLLLRISFEDDLKNNLQFIYQKLKYEETGEPVIMGSLNISEKEMAQYVKTRLGVNGFHIKMRRVDPSQWTYRNICNYVIEQESEGYEVVLLMLDYLSMIPTTGCTIGPMGTDIRDLFRRVRNFCSAKGITCITPHQLSTDVKTLIRSGMPEDQLLKEIAGKGYFSGSKQIDQEVDLELYIHLVKYQKETYLAIQRGKHRIPTILNDDDMFFLMKFPKHGMPLPDDINSEPSYLTKLPRLGPSVNNDDLFTI